MRHQQWEMPAYKGPAKLYHYTASKNLGSILESKKLWATHAYFLNDASEIHYGVACVREALERELRTTRSAPRRRLLRSVAWKLSRFDETSTFIAALTSHADDLNQWRSYAPGGGIAVGFPARRLHEFWGSIGCLLSPCEYRPYHQSRWARSLLAPSDALRLLPGNPAGWSKVEELLWQLPVHAAFLKDPAFAAESEWRGVVRPDTLGRPELELPERIRVRGGKFVPYVELPLPEERRFWKAVRITLSPELSNDQQAVAVQRLVRSTIGVECRVEPSSVPLRSVAA